MTNVVGGQEANAEKHKKMMGWIGIVDSWAAGV
jgi:hypothetical protein